MRVKLCEKYQKEREEICKKLIDILQLDSNNSFLLCDLDTDIEKQEKIMMMKDEIQKYFAVSSITPFKPNITNTKRPYLNIIRGILRQQGYTFESKSQWIKIESGVFGRTMEYKIVKN
jgi:hypothetical protein